MDLTQTLASDLRALRGTFSEWRGHEAGLQETLTTVKDGLTQAEERVAILKPAQEVLEHLEETWAGQYEAKLGALGSMGLNAVFPDNHYEVLLEHTTKRGTAHLDIILVKDDKRVRIKGGSGGSLVQLLAYLLRHLTTVSIHPPLRRILVLDEPFSQLAQAQRPAVSTLVRDITYKLGVQSILVSHEDELVDCADVAYAINRGGHVSPIELPGADRSRDDV